MFADNVKARKILSNGEYAPIEREGKAINAQEEFLR
jgi:hypothetical protein